MNESIYLKEVLNTATDWLSAFEWDWYVKLTFKHCTGYDEAISKCIRWERKTLNMDKTSKMDYFLVFHTPFHYDYPEYISDNNPRNKTINVYLLLCGLTNEQPSRLIKEWGSLGQIDSLERYDSNRGARHYLDEILLSRRHLTIISYGRVAQMGHLISDLSGYYSCFEDVLKMECCRGRFIY